MCYYNATRNPWKYNKCKSWNNSTKLDLTILNKIKWKLVLPDFKNPSLYYSYKIRIIKALQDDIANISKKE